MVAAEPQTKEEPVMKKGTTHVGMDVHKKDIAVAMLVPGSSEPVSWTQRGVGRAPVGEEACAAVFG